MKSPVTLGVTGPALTPVPEALLVSAPSDGSGEVCTPRISTISKEHAPPAFPISIETVGVPAPEL